jgi:hypothetical protein
VLVHEAGKWGSNRIRKTPGALPPGEKKQTAHGWSTPPGERLAIDQDYRAIRCISRLRSIRQRRNAMPNLLWMGIYRCAGRYAKMLDVFTGARPRRT